MSMDFRSACRHMIDSQLLPNKVTSDAIVAAFEWVPRETFVPDAKKMIAYADESLGVGSGRYLMEPMILARLIQESAPQRDDVALVVGGTTGYAAAILARIVSTVIMVEPSEEFADKATETLERLEINNVAVTTGRWDAGSPKNAPFDLILIDGAVNHVPDSLREQLSDGGRLVGVIQSQDAGGLGRAVITSRHGGGAGTREFADVGTPLLPGTKREEAFVF